MIKRLFIFFFLIFSHTVYGQSDSAKAVKTYIGVNLTRVAVGDVEVEIMRKLNNAFTVGIAAGYDFNFLDKVMDEDYGTRKDPAFHMESKEQMNSDNIRYWWGQGLAARIHIDHTFSGKNNQHFISLEGLFKERNYTDHYFGESPVVILESADQVISGLTFYYGTNHEVSKHFIFRVHYGIGFRALRSDVSRPAYTYQGIDYPATEKNYDTTLLSFHLGLIVLGGF